MFDQSKRWIAAVTTAMALVVSPAFAAGATTAQQPVSTAETPGSATVPCALQGSIEIVFDEDPDTTWYAEPDATLSEHPSEYVCMESADVVIPDPTFAPAATASSDIMASSTPVAMGTKLFTSKSLTYYRYHANTGTFNAQYTPGTEHRVAFGFMVVGWLQQAATSTAQATVTRSPQASRCSYSKNQGVQYGFHWSCMTPWNQSQTMNGTWTFKVILSGKPATATIRWVFNYKVGPVPCSSGSPC
jgi:hypothetical protein